MSLRIIINDAIINTSTAHRVPPFSQGILFPDRLLRAHRAVEIINKVPRLIAVG